MKTKTKTMSTFEIENAIVTWLQRNPGSSIEEIANGIGYSYAAVYKIVEGYKNSRSCTGLINNSVVKAEPSINPFNGRLVWAYSVV